MVIACHVALLLLLVVVLCVTMSSVWFPHGVCFPRGPWTICRNPYGKMCPRDLDWGRGSASRALRRGQAVPYLWPHSPLYREVIVGGGGEWDGQGYLCGGKYDGDGYGDGVCVVVAGVVFFGGHYAIPARSTTRWGADTTPKRRHLEPVLVWL